MRPALLLTGLAALALVAAAARADALPAREVVDRSALLSTVTPDAAAIRDAGPDATSVDADGEAAATAGDPSNDSGCACLVITPNAHGGRSSAVVLAALSLRRRRRDRR